VTSTAVAGAPAPFQIEMPFKVKGSRSVKTTGIHTIGDAADGPGLA
jgi:hypothetical protein